MWHSEFMAPCNLVFVAIARICLIWTFPVYHGGKNNYQLDSRVVSKWLFHTFSILFPSNLDMQLGYGWQVRHQGFECGKGWPKRTRLYSTYFGGSGSIFPRQDSQIFTVAMPRVAKLQLEFPWISCWWNEQPILWDMLIMLWTVRGFETPAFEESASRITFHCQQGENLPKLLSCTIWRSPFGACLSYDAWPLITDIKWCFWKQQGSSRAWLNVRICLAGRQQIVTQSDQHIG